MLTLAFFTAPGQEESCDSGEQHQKCLYPVA